MKNRLMVNSWQLVICGLLLAVYFSVHVTRWWVRANEYFGDGVMLTIGQDLDRGEERFVGVIRAWGWYAIYGTAQGCRIVPLWSPVGDAASVNCVMVFNDKGRKFSGWIDFRGHPRPFCGAMAGDFPRKCFKE